MWIRALGRDAVGKQSDHGELNANMEKYCGHILQLKSVCSVSVIPMRVLARTALITGLCVIVAVHIL
jgi:hypothetical protein